MNELAMCGAAGRAVARAAAAAAVVLGLSAGARADWPQQSWNPKPDTEDVALALPCGGKMAFRAVVTHRVAPNASEILLADKEITLGKNDADYGFMEYRRQDHIAGPFAKPNGDRYFLLAKYEVTQDQYDAVMQGASGGQCPAAPAAFAGYPKIAIGWYDAVEFTRRWNQWLYANAERELPRNGEAVGFVRLPSENEWEFAARGGLAVSDTARTNEADVQFPDLDNYAWFSGGAYEKKPRRIGLKEPSPLGFYDMLGNAAEVVLDGFQMNKVGRKHGQLGGFLARGGSIADRADRIRFSRRDEFPLFQSSTHQEMKPPQVGMRVAVGTVAVQNDAAIDRLNKEFTGASTQLANSSRPQPLAEIEALLRRQTDESTRRLQQLTTELKDEFRRRNELEVRATTSLLRESVRIFSEMAKSKKISDAEMENIKDLAQGSEDIQRDESRKNMDFHVANIKSLAMLYRENIHELAFAFFDQAREASGPLAGHYATARRPEDARRLEVVMRQVSAYRANKLRTERDFLRDAFGDGPWTK